jgi:glycosyltransferase involved in cell wall biosynthesis
VRILFVSGTDVGGSAHSTRELAERLVGHGHDVGILFRVEGPRPRYVHKRAINLVTKLGSKPGARQVDRVAALIGRTPKPGTEPTPYQVWGSAVVENAVPGVLRRFAPDVVVASSIGRVAWKRIRALLAGLGIPSVLYIREESGLGHLSISQAPPDLLLANSHTNAQRAAALGTPATMIPSVVTVDRYLTDSTRERVLFVNPVPSYGLETALDLAAARPDVQFAFVEWWKLADDERRALNERLTAKLPNVELRPATTDPARVYADARVLLAPFLLDGRPRVVLEAQANGIPVLARDLPALRETVGTGGTLVPADAPIGAWADALGSIIDDPDAYAAACAAARAYANRDEVDPERIVVRFEQAIAGLLAAARNPATGTTGAAGAAGPADRR